MKQPTLSINPTRLLKRERVSTIILSGRFHSHCKHAWLWAVMRECEYF